MPSRALGTCSYAPDSWWKHNCKLYCPPILPVLITVWTFVLLNFNPHPRTFELDFIASNFPSGTCNSFFKCLQCIIAVFVFIRLVIISHLSSFPYFFFKDDHSFSMDVLFQVCLKLAKGFWRTRLAYKILMHFVGFLYH